MQVHAGIRSREKGEYKDGGIKPPLQIQRLGEVNFGFGFDDEDCVGIGAAGGAEFLAGLVEGVGEDDEDDFALGAAYEVEAAFLLDEL